MRAFIAFVLSLLLASCAQFDETHYFKTVNLETGEPVNYFKLRVEGRAGFSTARYVAGFYDERAVDLFFNELKGSQSTTSAQLFVDNQKSPGTNTVLAPLDPTQRGAFVMILSTNATSVANTIGAFADNNVVADAVTNLINRNQVQNQARSDASLAVTQRRGAAISSELTTLFNAVPNTGSKAARGAYLDILNAISRALNAPQAFKTIEEAEQWLRGQQAAAEAP